MATKCMFASTELAGAVCKISMISSGRHQRHSQMWPKKKRPSAIPVLSPLCVPVSQGAHEWAACMFQDRHGRCSLHALACVSSPVCSPSLSHFKSAMLQQQWKDRPLLPLPASLILKSPPSKRMNFSPSPSPSPSSITSQRLDVSQDVHYLQSLGHGQKGADCSSFAINNKGCVSATYRKCWFLEPVATTLCSGIPRHTGSETGCFVHTGRSSHLLSNDDECGCSFIALQETEALFAPCYQF